MLGHRTGLAGFLLVVIVGFPDCAVQCVYLTQDSPKLSVLSTHPSTDPVFHFHVYPTPTSSNFRSLTSETVSCTLTAVTLNGSSARQLEQQTTAQQLFELQQVDNNTFRLLVTGTFQDTTLYTDAYHVNIACSDLTSKAQSTVDVTVYNAAHLHLTAAGTPSPAAASGFFSWSKGTTTYNNNNNNNRNFLNCSTTYSSACCRHVVAQTFSVSENVAGVALGELGCPAVCAAREVNSRLPSAVESTSNVTCSLTASGASSRRDYSSHVDIDDNSLALRVVRTFDRELDDTVHFTYTCRVVTGDVVRSMASCSATLQVMDVDDVGPYVSIRDKPHNKHDEILVELNQQNEEPKTHYPVQDSDSCSSNKYHVTLLNDYLNLFVLDQSLNTMLFGNECMYYPVLKMSREFPRAASPYEFYIIFNDTTFIPFNSNDNSTMIRKMIYKTLDDHEVHKVVVNETVRVNMSTLATNYTRIYSMGKRLRTGSYKLHTRWLNSTFQTHDHKNNNNNNDDDVDDDMFRVTPLDGIVYLNDRSKLINATSGRTIHLHVYVNTSNGTTLEHTAIVDIIVTLIDSNLTRPVKVSFCALRPTEEECVQSSGVSSPSGYCQWRDYPANFSQSLRLSPDYATCSPSLATCPNAKCDELERLFPYTCPQDCTTKRPTFGRADLNDRYIPKRGIISADSPCVCNWQLRCECMRNLTHSRWAEFEVATGEAAAAQQAVDCCDTQCSFIVLCCCVSVVFVACLSGFLLWRYVTVRRKKRKSTRGSGLSTEYAFGTQLTVEYVAPLQTTWTELTQSLVAQIEIDEKWEVSRECVELDTTIGEGEFGRVVKATVLDLNGSTGRTTVAIKMLKESASVSEYRDLLSEFNLLKDVSHRNVIKLLGICSRDGPLYLIVEYCEHGSMRSFLRTSRQRHFNEHIPAPPGDDSYSPRHTDHSTESTQPLPDVTVQDLLSFAWQIANGMEYLNEMKVVHRDLAARNVLLATGMVAKVSDFGLSRDIYEGDAYLKTTKGPLPVKWMAPESLFDQIYTSKSDVWSYGVVLWEIVTLGSNPYPGIAAEHLCPLLKSGYRMERPAACSAELYSVMMQCWQMNPADRPSFRQLSTTVESFLVKDTTYLDLSAMLEELDVYVDNSGREQTVVSIDEKLDGEHYKKPRPQPVVLPNCATEQSTKTAASDLNNVTNNHNHTAHSTYQVPHSIPVSLPVISNGGVHFRSTSASPASAAEIAGAETMTAKDKKNCRASKNHGNRTITKSTPLVRVLPSIAEPIDTIDPNLPDESDFLLHNSSHL